MRFWNKYVGTSSHSDELTGDFGNKPETILIGDHRLSCLLAEKLLLRDLRLLQQYLPEADISPAKGYSDSVIIYKLFGSHPTASRRHEWALQSPTSCQCDRPFGADNSE